MIVLGWYVSNNDMDAYRATMMRRYTHAKCHAMHARPAIVRACSQIFVSSCIFYSLIS